MAVVDVKEKWSTDESEGEEDGRRLRKGFTVLVDSSDDTALTARRAVGIPRVGDPWGPGDLYSRARRIHASPAGLLLFNVEVEYSSPAGSSDDEDQHPLDEPASINYSSVRVEEEIDHDVNGDPIANTLDEIFEGITEEYYDPVLEITRNQPSFDPTIISQYTNTTNEDQFFGEPVGRALIRQIRAESVQDGNLEYWRVTYQIQFRRELDGDDSAKAWQKRIANRSLYYLDTSGEKIRFKDDEGEPVTKEMLIDADSKPTVTAYWLYFKTKRSTTFGNLNII